MIKNKYFLILFVCFLWLGEGVLCAQNTGKKTYPDEQDLQILAEMRNLNQWISLYSIYSFNAYYEQKYGIENMQHTLIKLLSDQIRDGEFQSNQQLFRQGYTRYSDEMQLLASFPSTYHQYVDSWKTTHLNVLKKFLPIWISIYDKSLEILREYSFMMKFHNNNNNIYKGVYNQGDDNLVYLWYCDFIKRILTGSNRTSDNPTTIIKERINSFQNFRDEMKECLAELKITQMSISSE